MLPDLGFGKCNEAFECSCKVFIWNGGAAQIDFYRDDFREELAKLNVNTPVYVYCRSGNRSGQAAKMMKSMGFKTVYNLEGGIGAWARNQPIEK